MPARRRSIVQAIATGIGAALFVGMLALSCPSMPAEEYAERRAGYEASLRAWLRDSAVVDSVSRTFNLDSMYALHRIMLHHPRPTEVLQEITCERWRTTMRYHARPAIFAERRMMDTVWRSGESEAVRQLNERLPDMVAVTFGPSRCGADVERIVPDSVDGVSMTYSKPRPIPPRRRRAWW